MTRALHDDIATTYDEVPYGLRVYAGAHPMRIAAAAVLCGIVAPRVARSRVLELGCAEGGQLVHLAEEYPDATFVGIELSHRQVELAREHIATLGLRNVEVRQGDILDIDIETAGLGTFDYVLSHGVYSWVPAPVRDQMLAISRAALRADGLAYVSYNTYPMWHSAGVLRTLVLDATRDVSGTPARVEAARGALRELIERLDPRASYEAVLLEGANEVLESRDADVAHDFLSPVNDAMYLHEFAAHAAARGLRYVDDLVVSSVAPFASQSGAPPSTFDDVRDQQVHDLLHGSSLRAAVLCRDDLRPSDEPDPAALMSLHVAAPVAPVGHCELGDDSMAQFGFATGQVIGSPTPAVKVALSVLGDRWPASIPLRDLLDGINRTLGETSGSAATRTAEAVVRELTVLHRHHLAHLTAEPLALVTTVSERPAVAAAARRGMACGEPAINRWYEAVELEPPLIALVPFVDGTRTEPELVAALVAAAQAGDLSVHDEDGRPIDDPAVLEATFAAFVPEALAGLAQVGLLVA